MDLNRFTAQVASTVMNAAEVARFGGLQTGELPSEFEIASVGSCHRLLRYAPRHPAEADRPVAILVPPLMLTYRVYDVSENSSAVTALLEAGVDVWVVDFGTPEHIAGGMARTLSEHVHAISDAVDFVADATGVSVHLVGYSQGGMFCYQTAAFRRGARIASVVAFGSPVDLRTTSPMRLPEPVAVATARLGAPVVARGVPGWLTRSGFQLLDPLGTVKSRTDFLLALHDREALLPREGQRKYLMRDGWIGWPGPALQEFLQQFVVSNRLLAGGFTISGIPVTLADIQVPILAFVGTKDRIAPPAAVRAIGRAAPRAAVFEAELTTGHFGLVVGRNATQVAWPLVAEWIHWHSASGPRPDGIDELEAFGAPTGADGDSRPIAPALATGIEAAAALAGIIGAAPRQARRLRRLAGMQPSTRTSIARSVRDRAARTPSATALLFGDLTYSYASVDRTVDVVAEWLHGLGVRRGDAVGVLMNTRPSAVATLVALNRIGAVGVLLRPGATAAAEASLAPVVLAVADPDHVGVAMPVPVHRLLLDTPEYPDKPSAPEGFVSGEVGKSVGQGRLPLDVGRVMDTAFVFFTGGDGALRKHDMTNGQFMRTAMSAAAAANLRAEDTLYGTVALHNPLGLLAVVGAGVESGCRIAMASADDPDTFWAEIRRYGVTVVSYTGARLHSVVTSPPNPAEPHHHIRLFMGSGMPRGLWRKAQRRFPEAAVLEMWTSVRSGVVLANVRGRKAGSVGRPLPGSPAIRLARYDIASRSVVRDASGSAVEAKDGEVGLLLAAAPASAAVSAGDMRDVFKAGDAWIASGALFRCDSDGDYWLVDRVSELQSVDGGFASVHPMAEAVGDLSGVCLSNAFLHLGEPAVALTTGDEAFEPHRVSTLFDRLDAAPRYIFLLREMPLSSAHRPMVSSDRLQSAGVKRAWTRDELGLFSEVPLLLTN